MAIIKMTNVLFAWFLLAIAMFHGSELIDYISTSSKYRFGTEIGTWYHRSSLHYVGHLIVVAVAAFGGIGLGAVVKEVQTRAMIRGAIAVAIVGDMLHAYVSVN